MLPAPTWHLDTRLDDKYYFVIWYRCRTLGVKEAAEPKDGKFAIKVVRQCNALERELALDAPDYAHPA